MTDKKAPSVKDLFLGFAKIGILGFGGVVTIARHIIVEERKWVSDEEYATLLGIGQILPGANTINIGVMLGDRFQGKMGALACVTGLMLLPTTIVVLLALIYSQFANIPQVQVGLIGASAAAAGMVVGTGLKMMSRLKTQLTDYFVIGIVVAMISIFHFSLVSTLFVIIPISLVIARFIRK